MSSATGDGDNMSSLISAPECHIFTLAKIKSATKKFDEKRVIGQGGFGKVYKGYVRIKKTSHFVAIKRLGTISSQGASAFMAEITTLSKVRHCNLVSLIGYCYEKKEMILVYEYMPNGTLYHHLHKTHNTPLNWVLRLKIALGVARALEYLHTGFDTQRAIIHRDVKSSNILLDENQAAMLSDFGLSLKCPIDQSSSHVDVSKIKGTFGYMDPGYQMTGRLTRKTDVYAFGVVLFELLSGRLAFKESDDEDEPVLVWWAQKHMKEGNLDQMVDSRINGTILTECLTRFAQLADSCFHTSLEQRPTMAEVVVELQSLLALQKESDNSAGSSGIMGSAQGNSDHVGTSSLKSKAAKVIKRGMLSVTVISVEDLPPADLLGSVYRYVVLTLKKSQMKHKTRVVKKNLNPIWNLTFDFIIEDGLHDWLTVEVIDEGTFRKHYMGRCILGLTRVILNGEYKDSFPLDGAKRGKLNLNLKWTA